MTHYTRVSRRLILLIGSGVLLVLPAGVAVVRRFFSEKENDLLARHDDVADYPSKPYPATGTYPSEPYPASVAKVARKPLILSFVGPFSCGKELVEKVIADSWISISSVSFSDFLGEGKETLNVFYGRREEKAPCQVEFISLLQPATARDIRSWIARDGLPGAHARTSLPVAT